MILIAVYPVGFIISLMRAKTQSLPEIFVFLCFEDLFGFYSKKNFDYVHHCNKIANF